MPTTTTTTQHVPSMLGMIPRQLPVHLPVHFPSVYPSARSFIRLFVHSPVRYPLAHLFAGTTTHPFAGTATHLSVNYRSFCCPFIRLRAYSMYIPGACRLFVPACSFPSHHLLCCGRRPRCALWKSASGGEGYKRQGSCGHQESLFLYFLC